MFPLRFAGDVASHLFIIVFNVPASLRWRCGQSSLYYCIQCSRFDGDVASHLFINVFNDPASLRWRCGQSCLYLCIFLVSASLLPARFALLAMWPVISLLLYLMFPLRFAGDVAVIFLSLHLIFPLRFTGDMASHLFIIAFNVTASLRWRCGQSSFYGDVASHLFIIVFNVPASLLPARFASLAM